MQQLALQGTPYRKYKETRKAYWRAAEMVPFGTIPPPFGRGEEGAEARRKRGIAALHVAHMVL
eukprot:359060-Chlamydomonas_euryale.AAC.13